MSWFIGASKEELSRPKIDTPREYSFIKWHQRNHWKNQLPPPQKRNEFVRIREKNKKQKNKNPIIIIIITEGEEIKKEKSLML